MRCLELINYIDKISKCIDRDISNLKQSNEEITKYIISNEINVYKKLLEDINGKLRWIVR